MKRKIRNSTQWLPIRLLPIILCITGKGVVHRWVRQPSPWCSDFYGRFWTILITLIQNNISCKFYQLYKYFSTETVRRIRKWTFHVLLKWCLRWVFEESEQKVEVQLVHFTWNLWTWRWSDSLNVGHIFYWEMKVWLRNRCLLW